MTVVGQGIDALVNGLHYLPQTEIHSAPIVAGIGLAAGGATLHAARTEMSPGRARKAAATAGALAGSALMGYMGYRYGWAPHNGAGEAVLAGSGAVAGGAVGCQYPPACIDRPQSEPAPLAPLFEPDDRLTPDEVAVIFKRKPLIPVEEPLVAAPITE